MIHSRALLLPPWIPRLDEPAPPSVRGAPWVHALTPLLFVTAWAVAVASGLASSWQGAALLYPVAAIAVCCGLLPLAQAAGRTVDVSSAQALYRALWWLSPWLVFAWPVGCRVDSDGGAGGALGSTVLVCSSTVMLGVLPVTIEVARSSLAWSARRALTAAAFASMGLVALTLVASAWRTATHAPLDGLAQYDREAARFEPAHTTPGLLIARTREGHHVEQRRAGARCVTRFPWQPGVTHDCSAPVVLYWWDGSMAGSSYRPQYREQVFASVDGAVIGSSGDPRYMLFAAPLWEWELGGALALTLAVCTLLRTRRSVAAWRALAASPAVARDGHAHFPDGALLRLPAALAGHVGDVTVLGERGLAPAAFRDAPADEALVLAVDLAGLARALDDRESAAASFALAVLWLPAAPLLAAPFLGMYS
ncbi:MAG: hypothetical protein JWM10_3095 [Myxococcaceae bacterium]|nr:hypothetical protein [Myxococcaceae bacterium]